MDDKKKDKKTFRKREVVVLLIITCLCSIVLGVVIGGITGLAAKFNVNLRDSYHVATDKNLKSFVRNYKYIVNNYYEDINKEKLIDNAISGMMKSLDDPYSVYMDENESNSFNISLDGEYKGIGIQIAKDEEKQAMLVMYVFKDSPADKAGLKAGDYIIKLNNKEIKDKSVTEFSNSILKSDKKEFTLTIIRDEEQKDIKVSKNNVVIDSVISEIYERNDKKIGYLYISIFANNTPIQFQKKLKELENKKIDGLIIDVRDNTGGHLTSVEAMLESMLTKNQITYQLKIGKRQIKFYGKAKKNKDYKIVLLGNNNSASASEILISSLMDNLNCKFVGDKTYGKGTVQELVTLSNNEQYKITTKKWLTPKGKWINDTKGIKPTDEIKLDKKYIETHKDEDDNQLNKALDIISK